MAKSKRDAYAGEAIMPNQQPIIVQYFDRRRIVEVFGYEPPGHPRRKKIGWYWAPVIVRNSGSECKGPFLSSRAAMQDAIVRNPEARHAA
jgi:hypothetical protein